MKLTEILARSAGKRSCREVKDLSNNDLQDITVQLSYCLRFVMTLLSSHLFNLGGEVITLQSANRQDDARADIHARGFWGPRQSAFLT